MKKVYIAMITWTDEEFTAEGWYKDWDVLKSYDEFIQCGDIKKIDYYIIDTENSTMKIKNIFKKDVDNSK